MLNPPTPRYLRSFRSRGTGFRYRRGFLLRGLFGRAIALPALALAVLTLLALTLLALTGPAPGVRADTVRSAEEPVLRALGTSGAWRVSTGRGVTVGVLDSGVDGSVPDLAGSVTTGPDYTAGVNPPGYQPPREHGTYIASLIAGHGSGPGRADGVIGVAPAAHVLAVRVLLEQSEPAFAVFNENAHYDDTVAKGIRYAVAHGAGVINMSLGDPNPTQDEIAAIGEAISRGVVVVAAAGNDGTGKGRFTPYSYPASVPGSSLSPRCRSTAGTLRSPTTTPPSWSQRPVSAWSVPGPAVDTSTATGRARRRPLCQVWRP